MIAQYLEDGAYRFSMAFGRERFEDFYGVTADHDAIVSARRKWLEEDEGKYLAVLPEAGEMLDEMAELGWASGTLGEGRIVNLGAEERRSQTAATGDGLTPGLPAEAKVGLARWVGQNWEPDWLILRREEGAARLVAGCVCFPSSWSLEEKIARPIEEIHGVVPGLNASVGKQIGTFLDRIKPGVSWTRSNWGLSRSAAWNQHPSRKTPRLDETVALNEVFFRVEEQSLVSLPRTNGILFGIRLKVFPLEGYERTKDGSKLIQHLQTMPEPMAQYKGLSSARSRIIQLLGT